MSRLYKPSALPSPVSRALKAQPVPTLVLGGVLALFSLLWLFGRLHFGTKLSSGGAAVHLDAGSLFDPSIEQMRRFDYKGDHCSQTYSFSELNDAFVEHSKEWSRMGEEAVWWSVLTGHSYGTDIEPAALLAYYQEGSDHVKNFFRYVKEAPAKLALPPSFVLPSGVPRETLAAVPDSTENKLSGLPAATALDFGCGTGRLSQSLILSGRYKRVVCVDQSVPHLQTAWAEAQRRLGPLATRLSPLLSGPQLVPRLGGERFDNVFSLITLQHMVPPLQVAYIEQLCEALAPGGVGFLQIPDSIRDEAADPPFKCDFEETARRGGMQMHYLPRKEVLRHIQAAGCEPQGTTEDNYIGTAGTSVGVVFTRPAAA